MIANEGQPARARIELAAGALEQLQYAAQQGFPFRLCSRDLYLRMTFFQHGGEVLLTRYFENVKD